MNYPANSALGSYQANGASLAVDHANPHQLIDMLMTRALGRLAIARGNINRGNSQAKRENLSGVMAIIAGLQSFLDHKKGGTVSNDLDALYDYMGRQLVKANVGDDLAPLEEVIVLLKEIHGAWQQIKPDVATEHAASSIPA